MLYSTLSQFTSPSFLSKEKCCLCRNYSRPWSNWAPPPSTHQELAIEGSRDLKSIYSAPQRVSLCLWASQPIQVFLSRHPMCAIMCISLLLARKERKILNYATLTSLEAASVVPAKPLKSVWIIVLLVIINSCGNGITGITADAPSRRISPSGCRPSTVGSSFSVSKSVFLWITARWDVCLVSW